MPKQNVVGNLFETETAAPAHKDKPEDVRYNNYAHMEHGYVDFGSCKLRMSKANEAPHIAILDAGGQAKCESFLQNVVVATYSAGVGEHIGKHFIDIKLLAKTGHGYKVGWTTLHPANERHAPLIERIINAGDQDAQDAEATVILRECTVNYQTGEGAVHEYPEY